MYSNNKFYGSCNWNDINPATSLAKNRIQSDSWYRMAELKGLCNKAILFI